ncbi:hypothetical protein B0H66DRAFT_267729 [Apodospora peruviana]|uniref:Uncharacterized protein n=1 Tax=Apodospora peruviana TaxID=516989 RepID=A0AAE0I6U0_9PEZI|nr:hypothetical protein B0H66DRAFT_267729 [Apodospora peruviana]
MRTGQQWCQMRRTGPCMYVLRHKHTRTASVVIYLHLSVHCCIVCKKRQTAALLIWGWVACLPLILYPVLPAHDIPSNRSRHPMDDISIHWVRYARSACNFNSNAPYQNQRQKQLAVNLPSSGFPDETNRDGTHKTPCFSSSPGGLAEGARQYRRAVAMDGSCAMKHATGVKMCIVDEVHGIQPFSYVTRNPSLRN